MWTRVGRCIRMLAVLIMLCASSLTADLTLAMTAQAASGSSDAKDISILKNVFRINTDDVSDAQLAEILDSTQLGPVVRETIDCEYLGEHALDSSADIDAAMQTVIADSQPNLVGLAGAVVNGLASQILNSDVEIGDEVSDVIDLANAMNEANDLAKLLAALDSSTDYRSLLAQYNGFETEEGDDQAEATDELEQLAGWQLLSGIARERGESLQTLLDTFEATSQCMILANNDVERAAFATLIDQVGSDLTDYTDYGGPTSPGTESDSTLRANPTRGGLVFVPQGSSTAELINDGSGQVSDLSVLDGDGHALATLAGLSSGDSTLVDLGSFADAKSVRFSVDDVNGLTRSLEDLSSTLFASPAVASVTPNSQAVHLSIAPHLFAGPETPVYTWDSKDGTAVTTGSSVTHPYACFGPASAEFTAFDGNTTITRDVSFNVPPPWPVDFTDDIVGSAIAPGVPVNFQANVAIPSTAHFSWDFGDGSPPDTSGPNVTHTFSQTNYNDVITLSVTPAGSSCQPATSTTSVSVGRSDTWLPLSGTVRPGEILTSAVAGYLLEGPVTVAAGNTLTIEPGTNIKGVSTAYGPGQLLVSGTLKAAGAASAPVVFTSQNENSVGGNCRCNSTGTPAQGDWQGVSVLGGTAVLKDVDIRYASDDVDMRYANGSLSVTNSTFELSGDGIQSEQPNSINVDDTTFSDDNAGLYFDQCSCSYDPKITDSTFVNLSEGVWSGSAVAPIVKGSRFTNVPYEAVLSANALRTQFSGNTVTDGPGLILVFEGFLPAGGVRLSADLPYEFTGTVTVGADSSLTVPPAAVIKFGVYNGDPGQLVVQGSLALVGTTSEPPTLTSIHDDTADGHCACGTANAAPNAWDWSGVTIDSGASATIDHAAIRYAGRDLQLTSTDATVSVTDTELDDASAGVESANSNSLTVADSRFDHDSVGIQLDNCGCSYSPTVTDTTFSDDATGISVVGPISPTLTGSTFTGVLEEAALTPSATRTIFGRTTVTDGPGQIIVSPGTFPAGSITWNSDIPYVVSGIVTEQPSTTLTLTAGVVVKFVGAAGNPGEVLDNGSLSLLGSATSPVVLTSADDDTVGGTCACSRADQPATAGDWAGIVIGGGATATSDYAAVRYADKGFDLTSSGANLTISHSTLTDDFYGLASTNPNIISVDNSTITGANTAMNFACQNCSYSPNITHTVMTADAHGIDVTGRAAPTIHQSTIEALSYGIYNAGTATVDASYNWWGDPTGPAPAGSGSRIFGPVDVTPYCPDVDCQAPAPAVSRVSPRTGPTNGGTQITVTGSGFAIGDSVVVGQGNNAGAGAVAAINVQVVSGTKITATTGAGAIPGTWNLYVISPDGTVSPYNPGDAFSYQPTDPTVTGVSPAAGPTTGGTDITITGSGFAIGDSVVVGQGNNAGAGAIPATNVQVVSGTKITATTGGGGKPGTWNLYVIAPDSTVSPYNPGDAFTIRPR